MTATRADFDSDDQIALRKFLNETRAGGRLLPALAAGLPVLLSGGGVNEILIRCGEVRGAQSVLEALFLLANPLEDRQTEPEAYPSLTDDTAWNDGQKLTH